MFLSLLVIVVMAVIAMIERNFSANQMRAKGLTNGFPFLRHTGMWGNLFLVTPAVGIIGSYADQWTTGEVAGKLLIAAIITIVLHCVWSKMTDRQEHILGPGLTFTASGLVHAFYMTAVLAMVLLFYMNTFNIASGDALKVTMLLLIYLPMGNALVGKMKSGKWDAPGVIGTIALMTGLWFTYLVRF